MEVFDGAFLINAEDQEARRLKAYGQFNALGMEVERFPAITPDAGAGRLKVGAIGSNLSHCAVVRLARERGYRNVAIFEDDLVFRPDFMDRWRSIAPRVGSLSYDLFYFYNWRSHDPRGASRLVPIPGTLCVHAYVVAARYYDTFLARIMAEHTERIIDQILLDAPAEKWAAVPNLIGQDGGISTITGRPAPLRWSARDR